MSDCQCAERRRPPSPLRLSAVSVLVLLLSTGCNGKPSAPRTLADGSAAEPPPVALEDVSAPVVVTAYRVVSAQAIGKGSSTASCLRGHARGFRPKGWIVERTGVDGETVTIRDPAGVIACDSAKAGPSRWCGSSFGRLYGGDLRDPRLDIGACTSHEAPIAFAWVEPDPGARYVTVVNGSYDEVYPTSAGLPVRVSTRDVARDGAGATFRASEHDARGMLLRRFELHAVPAG